METPARVGGRGGGGVPLACMQLHAVTYSRGALIVLDKHFG